MAFQTRYSYFKYQLMLYRLFNAPASFHGYINKILAKKLDIFVIIYLNDIFIYNKNLGQDYVRTVRWVLNILKKHRLFINLKKCQFHKNKVYIWGYVVLAEKVRIEDK